MGVGDGLYMCDVVVKSSRSLSHLLMSSCTYLESIMSYYRECLTLYPSRTTLFQGVGDSSYSDLLIVVDKQNTEHATASNKLFFSRTLLHLLYCSFSNASN